MFGLEDVTAWTAVSTSAFAALLVLFAIGLLLRWRRASERRLRSVQDSSARAEELLSELTASLERAERENEAVRQQGERAEQEARRLRLVGELGSTRDLDAFAHRGLEHVVEETGADGAMAVLARYDQPPYTASFGLAAAESEREFVGLPAAMNEARAVTIRYRYSAEEAENDAFRLTCGVAVPLVVEAARIGMLAVFWRRNEHDPGDDEIARFEALAGTLAGPLENAQRFEEARRLADLDPLTGLQSKRYFADRLVREIARARRYERRLALIVFRLQDDAPTADEVATFGRQVRAAVRSADIPCYLGGGEFAVIAPEAALGDAERLAERMRFAAAARTRDGGAWTAQGAAELGERDTAGALLDRARAAARPAEPEAHAAPGLQSAT